ncbi:hypothetical protein BGX28_000708 [Mortierella sp. GBA30]|nr:hypothetical protein BGX28_000708 [Mortierella sp. GBA30]
MTPQVQFDMAASNTNPALSSSTSAVPSMVDDITATPDATSGFYAPITGNSQVISENYWVGEYLESQAFIHTQQTQQDLAIFQWMGNSFPAPSANVAGSMMSRSPTASSRHQQCPVELFDPSTMNILTGENDSSHQHQEPDSIGSDSSSPVAASASSIIILNSPAGVLRGQNQHTIESTSQDMTMTSPTVAMASAPDSQARSPLLPTDAITTPIRHQSTEELVEVKLEENENGYPTAPSVQGSDDTNPGGSSRLHSPFVEDPLRTANAIINHGGTVHSVQHVKQHAPDVIVQQMQLKLHNEQQRLQMQMQMFARMYGQPTGASGHGNYQMNANATGTAHSTEARQLQLLQPFQPLSGQPLGPVHTSTQQGLDQLHGHGFLHQLQPQGQASMGGIGDLNALTALAAAAVPSSLSQDLLSGSSSLRSLLTEGWEQQQVHRKLHKEQKCYKKVRREPAAEHQITPPSSNTLVMRNINKSRRANPYPKTASSYDACRHDNNADDILDSHISLEPKQKFTSMSMSSSSSSPTASSKTSNKHVYPNNDLPHRCDHPGCERTFASVGLLKSHIVSHNEDKKFWCDICSYDGVIPRPPNPPAWPGAPVHIPEVKRYKRNHDLLRHKREQHPPIEVKIQREVERQAAKAVRKLKNAVERRERNAVKATAGDLNGRNSTGPRSGITSTMTTSSVADAAAYMTMAREAMKRAYYLNAAGLNAGVSSNSSNSPSVSLGGNHMSLPNPCSEQNLSMHASEPEQVMQQFQVFQLQQLQQNNNNTLWTSNALSQPLINTPTLQQHPTTMTLMERMNAGIPYYTGIAATSGAGTLLPTPAPTAQHSRSGSCGVAAEGGRSPTPCVQNLEERGVGPMLRAFVRATVGRDRNGLSTVDEDEKGEYLHP